MNTNIDGPESPYKYLTRITNIGFVENATFTSIHIQVYDIQASIIGLNKEKFEVWFDDLSVIQDQANNSLSEGKIMGYLNTFEYVPPETREAASSGGASMKYTIISMFSINMLIKQCVSSSASLMWSLIHALQVFRFIFMININFPKLISVIMDYLAVVVGEVDEVEEHIPDIYNIYIINSDELNKDAVVIGQFKDIGYEKPYLTDLYGKQFFYFSAAVIIGVPLLYFIKMSFKAIPKVQNKFIKLWDDLFWNTPIRIFTELFIEISLGFFLHSLNVSIHIFNFCLGSIHHLQWYLCNFCLDFRWTLCLAFSFLCAQLGLKTPTVYQIKKVRQEIWNPNKRCVYEKDYASACILCAVFVFQAFSSFDLSIHIQIPNLSNRLYFGHASHVYFIPNKVPSIQI